MTTSAKCLTEKENGDKRQQYQWETIKGEEKMSVAGWGFGILFILLIWAVIIGVIALVAYFVIKKRCV